MSISLAFNTVSYQTGHKSLLTETSVTLPAGAITAVIGPNGSGKSTFLKLACRLLKPSRGEVLLEDLPIRQYRQRDLAQKMALLPQSAPRPLGMLVEDLVACGRHPYRTALGRLSLLDREKIDWALQLVDLVDRRQERVDVLSGGEMQRVWLAMILAQDTPLIMLDEPTSYLDLSHQFELLELVSDISRHLQKTIVWILHDINQALQFSDLIMLLQQGRTRFFGSPGQLLQTGLVDEVFQLQTSQISLADGQTYLHCRSNRQFSRKTAPTPHSTLSLETSQCD